MLLRKLIGYDHLFTTIGQLWPVLFWMHSASRERNLRLRLADLPAIVPVATGNREQAAAGGISPAEAVWTTTGGSGNGDAPGRLIDLRNHPRSQQH